MPINQMLGFFQIGLFIKLFFLVLALFYFVFTVVVYRQIMLMNQILESQLARVVKTAALVQVVVATGLFFMTILLA